MEISCDATKYASNNKIQELKPLTALNRNTMTSSAKFHGRRSAFSLPNHLTFEEKIKVDEHVAEHEGLCMANCAAYLMGPTTMLSVPYDATAQCISMSQSRCQEENTSISFEYHPTFPF